MGKQWKQCQTIFQGSKITADGDCSHEIKRRLLLGRKIMTNLDSVLKSTETCIISYKKWIASLGSMQDTGCLGLVHWDDPERWYGEAGGRGFRIGNSCTPVADSYWCMAKPIHYWKVTTCLYFTTHRVLMFKSLKNIIWRLPWWSRG